jgi:hypothetical protein
VLRVSQPPAALRGPIAALPWRAAALAAIALLLVQHSDRASGSPPQVLHTRFYQAPVRGGPGDLLLIAGAGFEPADRVVYEALDVAHGGGAHPGAIPTANTATLGTAPIVKLADPPNAITIQLPTAMEPERVYRLWVVDAAGEWSQALLLNDPRPLWIAPDYVYATIDPGRLGRTIRIVGRNLEPDSARALWVRLKGARSYQVASHADTHGPAEVRQYVAEAPLPSYLPPGPYAVAVSRDGHRWVTLPDLKLEVRPDPRPLPLFSITDSRFGSCRPHDGADDTLCFARALAAAREAGGGTVAVPAGTWSVSTAQLPLEQRASGFVLARDVHLQGAGSGSSVIVRRSADSSAQPRASGGPLLTLLGGNSVQDITFMDEERYRSIEQSRAVILLGAPVPPAPGTSTAAHEVDDVVITGNTFMHVGRGILDSGVPIRYLIVTHNVFGAYDNALLLTGGAAAPEHPFRIDDSVIRWNRFVPGSYIDVAQHSGAIATQLGASLRMDFSDNVADGTSTEALQNPTDARGWRAAFFWNLTNNQEEMLVAENRISCSGDKAGDGEAASFDGNRDTFAFDAAQRVEAAAPDWIRVSGPLLQSQLGRTVPGNYYDGHWISIVQGPGIGQSRRIASYSLDPATQSVTFRVSPRWDVTPSPGHSQIIVLRQYWQVYVVANRIDQASPPCRKSNLDGPRGGVIAFWTPTADSVIAANRQQDSDGIEFLQNYSARTPSCPGCVGSASLATALEIRDNLITGEYDWSSDCSWSGIRGYFVATPTPEAPPPVLGFGAVIAHNTISHADGQRGGAIDIAHAGAPGPAPGRWPMVRNVLIFGNVIRDLDGPAPRPACRQGQSVRAGIRIEGPANVRDTVLRDNRCERVDKFIEDSGTGTLRLCSATDRTSCECGAP